MTNTAASLIDPPEERLPPATTPMAPDPAPTTSSAMGAPKPTNPPGCQHRDLAAAWVSIKDLCPWKQNPRDNDAAVDAVAESISRFGFGAPIIARLADREIIAGHTRLKAAIKLGFHQVPVRYLDLSQHDAHLLALADNKTSEIAEWNDDALGRILADLREQEVDLLAGTGFGEAEIDALIRSTQGLPPSGVDPGAGEPPIDPESKLGEVYELGGHRIMCGDSTNADDVARLMGDNRAVLMATDPPYLVDYTGEDRPQSPKRKKASTANNKNWDAYKDPETSVQFFSSFIKLALQHALVASPAIYHWHASRRQALVEAAWTANGLLLHQQIIWVKSRPIISHSHFAWQHEPCFYGWIEGRPPALRPPLGGESTTVWTIAGENDGIHPTQKAVEIFERPIRYHTLPADIVFEPFSGSGTQIIAAAKLGRRCFAMELQPAFVDVARRRWTSYARSCGLDPGPGALE
jgi:DNA modification methylase